MSGRCTGWVLRHGPRPDDVDRDGEAYGQRARGYRAVLVTIADAANAEGEHSHPGLEAIVDGSLYGRRQATRILGELEAEGWITVEERGGGRGKATVYTVDMGWREKGRHGDLVPDPERVTSGALNSDMSPPETVTSEAETVPSPRLDRAPTVTTGKPNGVATLSTPAGADAATIDDLCAQLADAIERHGQVGRPKISSAWRRDMRLLLQRGPTDLEEPRAIAPEQVARGIAYTFERLADPGSDGFCWADQVRSPGALRRHWLKLAEAKRRLERGTTSKGARAVDRVASRMAAGAEPARTPLGLLPGGLSEGGAKQ